MDPLTYYFLQAATSSLETQYSELQKVIQNERKSRLEGEDTDNEFFCSQSVAHVLKAMNVLPSSVASTEYLPYSFSSEVELPLLRGATFSKELFIRGNKSSVFGGSNEEFMASIQKAISECGCDENGNSKCLEEIQEISKDSQEISQDSQDSQDSSQNSSSMENNHKSEEKEVIPHEDVLSILSPEDLSYVLTQLRMTRAFGRTSTDNLKHLLQSMKMYVYELNEVGI